MALMILLSMEVSGSEGLIRCPSRSAPPHQVKEELQAQLVARQAWLLSCWSGLCECII